MSHLHFARLSRGQSVVAIAGSTGRLGKPPGLNIFSFITHDDLGLEVSCIFLSSSFRPFFSRVICITRNPSSNAAKELAKLGGEIMTMPDTLSSSGLSSQNSRTLDIALTELLRGTDIIINLLGSGAKKAKEALLNAAINARARVYFPSEFGIDWRENEHFFNGWNHVAWKEKTEHMERARHLINQQKYEIEDERMQIVALFTGLFLENSISPLFGFDTTKNIYTCIGPSSIRSTYTSKSDIGRALAQLSILCMSPSSSRSVPEHVRIAGAIKSFDEIKDITESQDVRNVQDRSQGGAEITIERVDIREYKVKVKENYLNGAIREPAQHIRILMGEEMLDFSEYNDNDLVNPGQSLWKWKTLEEYMEEKSM